VVLTVVNPVGNQSVGRPGLSICFLPSIELHQYILTATESVGKLNEKRGIETASYGGQSPIKYPRSKEYLSSLDQYLHAFGDESRVALWQVLTKWLLQGGVVIVP